MCVQRTVCGVCVCVQRTLVPGRAEAVEPVLARAAGAPVGAHAGRARRLRRAAVGRRARHAYTTFTHAFTSCTHREIRSQQMSKGIQNTVLN